MKHGTVGAYRRGCRCDPCRAKKAESSARHRANRGQWVAAHVDKPADPEALTGGQWVPADGIMRWRPDGMAS